MSSQYGQDRFALTVLGEKRGGFFLDSGASDGVTVSNTLLLERDYGWRGICIEPNNGFFAQLERNRQCLCLNCCLYDSDTVVDFIEAHTLGGVLGDYDPSLLQAVNDMFRTPDGGQLPIVERCARSIRSILSTSGAPQVIDYWSLDTEGSELKILKAFPFDQYSFKVLTVEHNWLPVRNEIKDFLEGYGYKRVAELGCDDGYVNQALSSLPSWRSRVWSRRIRH